MIDDLFPKVNFQWTHNVYGFKMSNCFTLLRRPNQCIPSWIAFHKVGNKTLSQRLPDVIKWYERFMTNALESKTLFFCFDNLIQNPQNLINYLSATTKQTENKLSTKHYNKNCNTNKYEVLLDSDLRLDKSFMLYEKAKLRSLEQSL